MKPRFIFIRTKQMLLTLGLVLAMACSTIAATDDYTEKLTQTPPFVGLELEWIGQTPPSQTESRELWEAFGAGRYKSFDAAVSGVEAFIKAHPNSIWTPSLQANIGVYYRRNGYFTRALDDWQAAWNSTRQMTNPRAKMVADYALVNWLQLLSSLGRTDKMKELFDETDDRQIYGSFQALYQQSLGAYSMMLHRPEISYRCGTYALDAVAQVLYGTNYFKQIRERPSPVTGFSMADLLAFSDANHLNMVAVERPGGQELVVPSVVHWKQNHYAAIIAQKGDSYEVVDPTFLMSRWLKTDAINSECSGQFLVSVKQIPAGWRTLNRAEASHIFGKGWPGLKPSPPCSAGGGDGDGGGGGGGGGGSGGDGGSKVAAAAETPDSGGGGSSSCGCGGSGGSGGSCANNKCGKGPGSQGSGGGGNGSNGGGGGGGGGSSSNGGFAATAAGGMPTWTVMEPWCSVWITDEPLSYQPSKGPRISFKLSYWSEGQLYWPGNDPSDLGFKTTVPGLSRNWICSWVSYIIPADEDLLLPAPSGSMLLYSPGGGRRVYTNFDGTVPEFTTNTRMLMETNASGDILGFKILYPSGAEDIYTNMWDREGSLNPPIFLMSQQLNPDGYGTAYIYMTNDAGADLLDYVVDGDGQTNFLSYTTAVADSSLGHTNYNLISQITDRFGHTVSFAYNSDGAGLAGSGELTNITDVAGISSSFGYTNGSNPAWVVKQIETPYGKTCFFEGGYGGSREDAPNNPYTIVSEPNGSHQMFFMELDNTLPANYAAAIPQVYTDPRYVPTNRPTDNASDTNTLDNPDWSKPSANDNMQINNSFYWGREQFANLSANFLSTAPNWNLDKLQTNDFILARMRHWNQTPDSVTFNNLSMEREPSPDIGLTSGEMTWYDYPNKPDYFVQGSSDTPTLKIKVLPDGTEWYQISQLDQWNNPTNVITTYSTNGVTMLRTNSYVYAPNGQDLLQVYGADSVRTAAYGYDANHEVLFMTNALGEVTGYAYANGQLTSMTAPNGQLTTNIYGADGFLAQQIVLGISTNFYTWTNALVYAHTDPRGLTVTNSWDPLNRLTNVLYPDGTSISYIYSNLDIVKTIDRMGYATTYTYNPIRQRTSVTDARNNTTLYGYCECGALDSITDALQNVTYFIHDNQGNLIQTLYPDGYSVTNTFNLLHQLVARTDSSGAGLTNFYNNQGLLIVSSNNVGLVRALVYDVDDRITNSTDANGVSVGMTYDNLYRLLTRHYPDNGVESYGYTTDVQPFTSYTNQIGKVWLYGYDSINRKTNEVCSGITTNRFTYNSVGDLLALADGKNQTTKWGYDQYGRVTNKLDALGITNFVYQYDIDNRLTNRWTPAKANTAYRYDLVGNLTNVNYPGGVYTPSISLTYDADNRLTSMLDGIGTTAYSYDEVGQLLSEGGLWPDDTVSNAYQNRLRMDTSLAQPSGSSWTEDYEYDAARRLTGVESPAGSFNYTYDPVRLLKVDELGLPGGAYITNSYDSVARTLSTVLMSSSGTDLDSARYAYNAAGQRISETNAAGDYRTYAYDNEGELTGATGTEANGNTRYFDRSIYAYDPAGNLKSKTRPLLSTGNVISYLYNSANQITNSLMGFNNFGTWQTVITVSGSTTTAATNVTVNGQTGDLYADNSFDKYGLFVTNGSNKFTAIAVDVYGNHSTNISSVNVIITNNAWAYDANGNLTSDGVRQFAYDDENELISVCVSNAWSNSFAYDGKMRRRIEQDYSWDAGTSGWVETNEMHFIYDGNVVVEERNANNNPLVSYTRGHDLSGKRQGAGGVGGLLARTSYGQEIPGTPTTSMYHSDGNGNVTCLIYTNQQIAAKYLYDPYGNTLTMYGPLMNLNKYRFSSKEWNDNAGLYYYLYRFYDPNLQRWSNRDPLGDAGSLLYTSLSLNKSHFFGWFFDTIQRDMAVPNLYDFVNDDPNDKYDLLGLDPASISDCGSATIECAAALATAGAACDAAVDTGGLALAACRAAAYWAAKACAQALKTCDQCFNQNPPPNNPPVGPAPPNIGCSICPVNGPPVIYAGPR